MILHDSTFETLATAPVKTTDIVVARQISDIYGYHDDTVVWQSSDVLMSVNIDSVGDFINTATKKATVKLLGTVDGIVQSQIFQVRSGLYDSALQTYNYISQGFFIVDNVAYDYEAGSTTVTMYDHMWLAQNTLYETTVESTGFTFPATVEQLATYAATTINTSLMADFSLLPNADYSIAVDPYTNISNVTIQNVIQEIAAATGTTARISDTTLIFTKFTYNYLWSVR